MINLSKRRQFKGVVGHPDHGFGYVPDPQGHRYLGFQHHPAAQSMVAALPRYTNNVAFAPPAWNQGQTSSCFGHGTAGLVTTTFAARGRSLSSPVSPRIVYQMAREINRLAPQQPLADGGAQPCGGVLALGLWGCVLEEEVDGGRTADSPDYVDYLQAHVCDGSKLGELETARKRILVGFNAVADNDPAKIVQYQLALASGHAVGAGVDAGNETFQSYTGGGVLDYCGDEPDHWIFILDYRITDQGECQFLLQNSWGRLLWTPDGRAWVTEDFVRRGCFNSLVANMGV